MRNQSLILSGKLLSQSFRLLNLGNGSTWPGHIALKANPQFIHDLLKKNKLQTIIVAGTNGKTTTSLMIKTILETNGKRVIHNSSGANLLNGIASTLLLNASPTGKINADFAIFEVDENALPLVLKQLQPDYLILLNLFRDQLDRYGEVRTIAEHWDQSFTRLLDTLFIINADDPELGYADMPAKRIFFGLNEKRHSMKKPEHAADSIYCPQCGSKLEYKNIYYSHLGNWSCPVCKLQRPELTLDHFSFYPLPGLYNQYNTLAAVLTAKQIGLSNEQIEQGLHVVKPAFGRQEIIDVDGKKVQIFLSKNPTGFNESLRTIKNLGAKNILLVLNDNIADGTDVSWIWDIDMEMLNDFAKNITISGTRCYDLALRIKYVEMENGKWKMEIKEDLKTAIGLALEKTTKAETLFVLPTYTAMLDLRKIISGKKIL